jgi:NAD(P)-dependent dehydrogenase (short-subunit alcohol dehydrogenase family)
MKDFAGKVAVVTGAASGIGLGLATRFAQEGMRVVLGDVEAPALEAAVTRLRQQEYDVLGVVTDVTSLASVEALRDKAVEAYGGVHVLCNNAGVGGEGRKTLWEASGNDWRWLMDTNVWSVVHGIRAFVPHMLAQGEPGHIVNTASVSGLVPANRIYSVTKQAVVALSEALYNQLSAIDAPLHCSVLCPSWVTTQISQSARNRPPALTDSSQPEPTPQGLAARDLFYLAPDTAIEPSDVAAMVFDAIVEERFWVITHHDQDDHVRMRFESMLARRNPEVRKHA